MASNNSDNASASMVASDREQEDCNEVSSDGSALTSGSKTQQKRSVKFRAWSFQLTINANLLNFTTTLQKRKLLTELLSNRAAAEKPFSVTSISTFCNESQLSGEPDSNGLVSIEVYGYVQTKNATPISTMQKLIESASWKPVPGGLMSDRDFKQISESGALLYLFGKIGLNNAGREEARIARKVGYGFPPVTA